MFHTMSNTRAVAIGLLYASQYFFPPKPAIEGVIKTAILILTWNWWLLPERVDLLWLPGKSDSNLIHAPEQAWASPSRVWVSWACPELACVLLWNLFWPRVPRLQFPHRILPGNPFLLLYRVPARAILDPTTIIFAGDSALKWIFESC